MNKDDLIVKQQLEIESLKDDLKTINDGINEVHGFIYNIGAPMNDNIDGFTPKQLKVFRNISESLDLL